MGLVRVRALRFRPSHVDILGGEHKNLRNGTGDPPMHDLASVQAAASPEELRELEAHVAALDRQLFDLVDEALGCLRDCRDSPMNC